MRWYALIFTGIHWYSLIFGTALPACSIELVSLPVPTALLSTGTDDVAGFLGNVCLLGSP